MPLVITILEFLSKEYIILSSASLHSAVVSITMSLMKMLKNIGARMERWGTPVEIFCRLLNSLLFVDACS